jgi:DNA polymerase-3 subunit epsilon
MKILFFDTETTGIRRYKGDTFVPRLVQLGAILQDSDTRRVLAEVNLIAHPGLTQIPDEVAAIHGITTDMAVDGGVPMGMIDSIFANLLDKAELVVAHNFQFDADVVLDNLESSITQLQDKKTFCTMLGSVFIVKSPLTDRQKTYFTRAGKLPDYPFKVPTLMETHKYFFKRGFDGAHDAMADVRACRDIYFELLKLHYSVAASGDPIPSTTLQRQIQEAEEHTHYD